MSQSSLWKITGFIPFVSIAFLNAFTDLGHKIMIQNTLFKVYEGDELTLYTSIIQMMILLPFLLAFTPAGFLSDRFSKVKVVQYAAFAAIPITVGITMAYYFQAFEVAFALTFALGLQSAIYSPAKYSLIRELVGKKYLAGANSAIQAITIVAILGGTAGYSFFFEKWVTLGNAGEVLYSVRYAGFLLVAGAVIEWLLSLRLPKVSNANPDIKFQWSSYFKGQLLRQTLKSSLSQKVIKQSIVGLSIFWAINQVLLASFGTYFKEVTGSENTLLSNGIMGLAGIGIILGSVVAAKLSKNYIETGLLPISTLGLALSLMMIPTVTHPTGLMVVFGIYGFFGGMFLVPLNSLIQFHAGDDEGGRVLASNNLIQTLIMVAFLTVNVSLSMIGVEAQTIFITLGLVATLGCIWTLINLPQSLVRIILKIMATPRYKLKVTGLNQLPHEGGVLLLGNHISWIDWAILQLASPRPIRFVMLRSIYEKWYLKWFLDLCGVIPIARGSSKDALRAISESLKNGEAVALFPEGHISQNGTLSTFRSGFERAVEGTGASIVPFYLHGLWGSKYSYAQEGYREKNSQLAPRQLVVSFGQKLPTEAKASKVKQAVQALSIQSWNESIQAEKGIANAWLKTVSKNKFKKLLSDQAIDLKGYKMLTGVLLFRNLWKKKFDSEQNIGFLLPPAPASIIAKLSTIFLGKTIVPLNYTSPESSLIQSVQKAEIKTIITSAQFLKKLKGRGLEFEELLDQVEVIQLEDEKQKITKINSMYHLMISLFMPRWMMSRWFITQTSLESTLAILFSSGSEGTPKGVELSNANIMGNVEQVSSLLNPNKEDVILGQLPLFHAFGLTVTSLLPLLKGIPLVTHPDPLDVKKIGQIVAKHQVTFMCGTSTFLNMYARSSSIHPLMFGSLRMVVSGAEKLKQEVRQSFFEKFGLQVLEGYGTTETTPVASVNLPDTLLDVQGQVQKGQKVGSVGFALPGSCFKIVDPETLTELPEGEDGLILIGGNQIMKGYLKDTDKTQDAIVESSEGIRWYKSGDKGHLDQEGFLTIVDRYSRFAKLAGEMISLTAVEGELSQLLDENAEVLTVALPHPTKGEQLVALVAHMDLEKLKQKCAEFTSLPSLYKPAQWITIPEIPKLGTGKVNLAGAKKYAWEKVLG